MSVVDNNKMLTDFIKIAVSQEQLIAVTMPTLPRIAYIDSAFTGNVFPYFSNWNSARAALLALTPVPDVTHPAWATRFSAADGTQIDIGGDTAASLAAMGIILRDGRNGINGTNGVGGATVIFTSTAGEDGQTVKLNIAGTTEQYFIAPIAFTHIDVAANSGNFSRIYTADVVGSAGEMIQVTEQYNSGYGQQDERAVIITIQINDDETEKEIIFHGTDVFLTTVTLNFR